jgi:hypothetical protein
LPLRTWKSFIHLGFAARLLEQLLLMQGPTNRLPAYWQKQLPTQELADLPDAQLGIAPLEFDDLRLHRRSHFRPRRVSQHWLGLQARFALIAVQPHPLGQGTAAYTHLARHLRYGETFFQAKLNRFPSDFAWMGLAG